METNGCYPKWLYHAEKEACMVRDLEAHKAMGPGWVESPALIKRPEGPKESQCKLVKEESVSELTEPVKRRGRKPKGEVA
jgi:hypothetical protein